MSTTKKMILSRRAVLRGVALGGGLATLPLPRLNAMFDGNGLAYAAGGTRKIFGVWFYGDGVVTPTWAPEGTGPDFKFSPQLAALEKVRRAVTVVSGMAALGGKPTGPHRYGCVTLTGGAPNGRTVPAASIDQVLQPLIGADTPFPSLEVGCNTSTPGFAETIALNISHKGPNAGLPPEFDPRKVFNRLFPKGAPSATPSAPPDSRAFDARRSVIDAVTEDLQALESRLGSEDKVRLDHHLEGLRSLEKRLGELPPAAGGGCTATDPGALGPTQTVDGLRAEVSRPIVSAMTDLVIAALSCDLTRVFSFAYTYPAAKITYKTTLGLTKDDIHGYFHTEPGNQPDTARAVAYVMDCFAEMLAKMDAVKEGATTLLDTACVYTTTCTAWGHGHTNTDWPMLIGGRAGGALKGNVHIQAPGENTTKVLLTLANIYGKNVTSFGSGAAAANAELSGIKA
jgi:hypothetical protein